MQATIEIPEEMAQRFAATPQELSRAAIEALAIEGVRSGKLSTGQVRHLLGFSTKLQVDGFLRDHGVYLPLTLEGIEREAALSQEFRDRWQ